VDTIIFRKDRSGGYGGVLFTCRNDIQCTQLTFNISCEVIACKVKCKNCNLLIVVFIYRPPHRDLLYMQNLCNVLQEIITSNIGYTIWLTGDLNLPDIDWNSLSVTSHCYPMSINNHFLDLTGYSGFTQLVDTPTRDNHILDKLTFLLPTNLLILFHIMLYQELVITELYTLNQSLQYI